MVPRVKRCFCYGVALASLLWGSILVMYLHLQDPSFGRGEFGRRHQRFKPRHDFIKNFPLQEVPAADFRPENHGAEIEVGEGKVEDPDDLSLLGVIRTAEDQQKRDHGYRLYAFNDLISERLGFHRSIPDVRHHLCRDQQYPSILPKASVIICFYNEAWSTLLRTVHSVLDRSPANLIHEIILVDDDSDLENLGKPLEDYIAELPKVKLVRAEERQGLIRARMLGADFATGKVLIFLDSHCEVNVQWLEPLLARIMENSQTVAIPLIDIINHDTFQYEASPLVRGGFNWGLHFRWDNIPRSLLQTEADYVKPIRTATMAGGLFAISRQYFNVMGKYDAGMDVWGGENLEISFRIWQCGGQLEIIPCSRVAHVFRKRRPYGDRGGGDSMMHNSLRVAHVWMDEYKEHYFKIRPEARNANYGDIESRIALRKKLRCKSFKWYLENVYPEQSFPDEKGRGAVLPKNAEFQRVTSKVTREGHLRHKSSGLCLKSAESVYDKHSLLKLAQCVEGEKTQVWSETSDHYYQLSRVLCLDVESAIQQDRSYPKLMKCHYSHGSQEWHWTGPLRKQLLNPASGKCLSVVREEVGAFAAIALCDDNDPLQKFEMRSFV